MPRQKRDGPRKREVLIRLEPALFEVAHAAKAVTGKSLQELLEPVVSDWLEREWREHPAITSFFESRRLLESTDKSGEAPLRSRPAAAPAQEAE